MTPRDEKSPTSAPHVRLRVGLVGCGQIATIHVAALRAIPEVEIVAVCDLNRERADAFAKAHEVPIACASLEDMIDSARPDVVHLLTPPHTHAPLSEMAASRRIHLYVEKPFATAKADAERIVEAARQANVRLCPGHNRLFDPVFRRARQIVASGRIGDVVFVRAEQGFGYDDAARSASMPWSYTYEWGILEDLIPHPLYLVGHFLARPGRPQVTALRTNRIRETAAEEIRVVIPSERAIGEVALSLTGAPERNTLEIVGTTGRVVVDFVSLSVTVRGGAVRIPALGRFIEELNVATQSARSVWSNILGIATGRVVRYPGLRRLVAEFYRSIRENGAPPVAPEDGVLCSSQLEQIREACATQVSRRKVASRVVDKPRVLVTGATGLVGSRLVRRFSEQGIPVRAMARLETRAVELPHVEWQFGDLGDESLLESALESVREVHHCAALVGVPGTLEEFRRANVETTERLLRLGARNGVDRVVYLSSAGVYGLPPGGDYRIDESAPLDGAADRRGSYTQTKVLAELAVQEWVKGHSRPTVVLLRPGLIYGPGGEPPLGCLRLPIPAGQPIMAGPRTALVPLVHVDNVVDAMLLASRANVPSGRTFNLVDDPDLSQATLRGLLAAGSAGRIRPRFLPYPVVWGLMLALDLATIVLRRTPGTFRMRLKRNLVPLRFDTSRARAELGWNPRVTIAAGVRDVVGGGATPFPR